LPSEDEAQALAALHCPQGKLFQIKLQTPVTTYLIFIIDEVFYSDNNMIGDKESDDDEV
jgi:hypothetical protein